VSASRVRFIALPLGLCALAAVGVHSAADVLGDRLLWLVDRIDAFLDGIFSAWSVTAPLVDVIGLQQRTWLSRGAALLWELSADLLLAVPLLGYEERAVPAELALAKKLWRKLLKKPTPLRLVRPLCTAAVAIAGSCAVARLMRSTLLHYPVLAQLLALATLLSLLALLASRAALRSLEHADAVSDVKKRRATLGLFTSIVIVPLAVAALWGASPLLSFFR
jgi:hypothetical protein